MNYGVAMQDIKKGDWIDSDIIDFRPTPEQLEEHGNYQALIEINKDLHAEIKRRVAIHTKLRDEITELKSKMRQAQEILND